MHKGMLLILTNCYVLTAADSHTERYHNLNIANHQIRDPYLTGYGEQQCAHLAKTFPYTDNVDLVVASPLKRTIYTALNSFPEVIAKRKLKVIAIPELQETSDLPCDTGSRIDELKREFADQPVSLDLLESQPDWYSKKGRWAAAAPAIEERCRVARQWLRAQPQQHIVAVTHGGLLHFLTEDWQGMDKMQGKHTLAEQKLVFCLCLWQCWSSTERSCSVFAERRVEHYESKHPSGHLSREIDHLVASIA